MQPPTEAGAVASKAAKPVPLAPIFARSAGTGLSVLEETIARQRAAANGSSDFLFSRDFADDADEDDATAVALPHDSSPSSGAASSTPQPTRKSPVASRRSPGVRYSSGRNVNPPPTKVLDFLFLGSVQDAKNVEFLKANNITQIINVSQEEYYSPDPSRVVVRWFYAEDTCNFDIRKHFSATEHILATARRFYFAEKDPAKRERVLVHCQKGRSRSATIVMAHLIRSNGWSVAEALQWVSNLREQVEPNLGFIEALREYQESMPMAERNGLRARNCLLIRNLLSEEMVMDPQAHQRSPHTPLERGPRTSADGTSYPLLTLDVLKKFFNDNVGLVWDVQVKVKTKEIQVLDGDEERDEGKMIGDATNEYNDCVIYQQRKKNVDSNHSSSSGEGDASHPVSQGETTTSESTDCTPKRLHSMQRTPSNLGPRTVTMKSAQILVSFACYENVSVAGMLKRTDVNRFLPLCPEPQSLLFQNPLRKSQKPTEGGDKSKRSALRAQLKPT